MANKQTRRSVSMSAETYGKLKEWTTALDVPMSQFVENLIKRAIDGKPPPKSGTFTF